MKRFITALIVYIGAAVTLGLGGCASMDARTSAQGLKMVQDSIIVVAKAADRMCDDGLLSRAQCVRSAELYTHSREVYREALEAELFFIDAQLAGDDGEKYLEAKTKALRELIDLGRKLREIVDEY